MKNLKRHFISSKLYNLKVITVVCEYQYLRKAFFVLALSGKFTDYKSKSKKKNKHMVFFI